VDIVLGRFHFVVGLPRLVICLPETGSIGHTGDTYAVGRGDVWLLPAVVGACAFQPDGDVTVLEVAPPA
jgi:uncharacterized protein YjlB